MRTVVSAITTLAPFIYILAAVGIFFAIRSLVLARRARRIAAFGLEREAANRRQSQAISTIVTLLLVGGAVYIVSQVIAPNLPEETETQLAEEGEATPTPTVEGDAPPTPLPLLYPTVTPIPGFADVDAGQRALEASDFGNCGSPNVTITSPEPGETLSGQINVSGVANTFPFFEYKFEVSGPGTDGAWVVVGNFSETRSQGFLGTWDSTSLPPGDYTLRLLVYLSPEQVATPCEVPITITR